MLKRTLRNLIEKESKLFLGAVVSLVGLFVVSSTASGQSREVLVLVFLCVGGLALIFAVLRSALPPEEKPEESAPVVTAETRPESMPTSAFIRGKVSASGSVRDNYTEADYTVDGDVDGDVSGNTHRPKR